MANSPGDAVSMHTWLGRVHCTPSTDSANLITYTCLGSPGDRPHRRKQVYHIRHRSGSRRTAVDPIDRYSSLVRGRIGARDRRPHWPPLLRTANPRWFWNGVNTVGIQPT